MKGSNILDTNRLKTLMPFDVMDTHPELIYDKIISLVAAIYNTLTSLISLVDNNWQFFKSHYDIGYNETTLEESFCKHIFKDVVELLIVENTQNDKRFAYFQVKENPNIRFYAGTYLTTSNGFRLGTTCVLDNESKELNDIRINGLKTLAKQVVPIFKLRKTKKLEEKRKEKVLKRSDANFTFHELVKKIQGRPFKVGKPVFSNGVSTKTKDKWKSYFDRALTCGRFLVKQKIQHSKKFLDTYGLASFDLMYNKKVEKWVLLVFLKILPQKFYFNKY